MRRLLIFAFISIAYLSHSQEQVDIKQDTPKYQLPPGKSTMSGIMLPGYECPNPEPRPIKRRTLSGQQFIGLPHINPRYPIEPQLKNAIYNDILISNLYRIKNSRRIR